MDDLTEHPQAPRRHEPLRRVLDAELVNKVREAIADLPPLQREALVLFEYEELPMNEMQRSLAPMWEPSRGACIEHGKGYEIPLAPYLNTSQEIVTLGKA